MTLVYFCVESSKGFVCYDRHSEKDEIFFSNKDDSFLCRWENVKKAQQMALEVCGWVRVIADDELI